MPVKVQLKMTVPLLDQTDGRWSWIHFCRWLPSERESLIYTSNGLTVKYWADWDCFMVPGRPPADQMSSCPSITIAKIYATAECTTENESLYAVAEYCAAHLNYSDAAVEETFGKATLEEYYAMGRSAYAATMTGLNRLIGYIRSKKGQHWLDDHPVLDKHYSSEFLRDDARIRFDNDKWMRLRSSSPIVIDATVPDA